MLSVAEYRALMGHDAQGKTDAEIARLRDQDREGARMVLALFDERARRRAVEASPTAPEPAP